MEKEITISPAEFKRRLDKNEVRFIFDLREKEDIEAMPIEGHVPIETLNVPRYQFVGEEEKYINKFPKDREITAICAHGDSSRYSAEQLREQGYDAVSLGGGIDSWSAYYETVKVSDSPLVYQSFRVARGCISYLIASGGEAAVIDSARHFGHVLALAERLGVKVKYVLDTHLHADHISGGRELADRTGAAYFVNPADMGGATVGYQPLADGQKIRIGGSEIEVIHSPGHTPGSTSFLLDGKFLFTGDTIMKESIGRPDLGGRAEEWSALLHATLFKRFARMPDETVALPAHATSIKEQDKSGIVKTTLGDARRDRDLFRLHDLQAFTACVKENLPENPERYQEIRKVNLGLKAADEAGRKEMEIGKNLCGMVKR